MRINNNNKKIEEIEREDRKYTVKRLEKINGEREGED